jgi:hypothetical protein
MGATYSAELRFGIALPNDYLYEHYGPLGANLEEDSERQAYEYPLEAMEAHVERLTEGTNLSLVTVGYPYEDETARHILAYKEPTVKTGGSGDDYIAKFEPSKLNVGDPAAHPLAIKIAKTFGLDWTEATWLLCWSVG